MAKKAPHRLYLTEDQIPTAWYNLRADMKEKPEPMLNPATGKPVSVNVGIHTDNASGEEILYLCRQAEELAERFISQYIMEKKKQP